MRSVGRQRMQEKILFVDDEINVLEAYKRQLRKSFKIDVAEGGKKGLELIEKSGPYAVVISDYSMPEMDGNVFLAKVKEASPDTVRMMLTGYADLDIAIRAVNEGNIFRFLTKPTKTEEIIKTILSGIQQYRLVTAEKVLLEKTLNETIRVLGDILSFVNPDAWGRALRITQYVKKILSRIGSKSKWRFETAARLSQIGCVILPESIMLKIDKGEDLTEEETQLFNMHPQIGSGFLSNIPRMGQVAEIIAYQEKHYNGGGVPVNPKKEKEIPLGARILKVVIDFDLLESKGIAKQEAINAMKAKEGVYDPSILSLLSELVSDDTGDRVHEIPISELSAGMVLADDVFTMDGNLLFSKGLEFTEHTAKFVKELAHTSTIREPIKVTQPKPL